ncbi:MAG: hypothetical protein Q7R47_04480, partial [Candidatus Diapherotrites archaeon]|nr:hypothetical protein [Candidatus Diapherotrites archaeon]
PIQSGKSTNKEYYGDKCGVKVRLSDETVSDFLFDEGLLDTAAKQFNVRLVLKSKPTEAYVDSFLSDPNYYAKHFLWSVLPRNSLGGNPKALNVNTIDPLVDNRTVSVTIGGKSGTFEFKQQAGATPHIKLFLDGHECTSSKQETQKDAEGYYGPDTSVSGGKEYYWNECGLKLVVNFVSGNTYSLSQLMLDDASLPSYFLAYSAPSPVAPPVVNPNALSVQVIQDGKVVAPQNGTITVDRKPFVLRFGAPASSSNVTFYFNVKNSRLLAVNAGTSISDISARVNSNSVASDYYFPLNDDRFLEADIYGTQSTACSLKTDAPYKACEIQVKGIVDSTGTQVELANSKAASLDFVIVQDTDKDGKLSAAEIVPVSVSFSSQPQCSSFLECLARIDLGFVKNLLALLNPVATK